MTKKRTSSRSTKKPSKVLKASNASISLPESSTSQQTFSVWLRLQTGSGPFGKPFEITNIPPATNINGLKELVQAKESDFFKNSFSSVLIFPPGVDTADTSKAFESDDIISDCLKAHPQKEKASKCSWIVWKPENSERQQLDEGNEKTYGSCFSHFLYLFYSVPHRTFIQNKEEPSLCC